jgi:nuclear transport factor 2 (NTF2) superfamily protein
MPAGIKANTQMVYPGSDHIAEGTIVEDAPRENRIAVLSAYEWHDDSGHCYCSYGNENWEFDEDGLMRVRIASINDVPIKDGDRKYHWTLGRRPDDHPSLSDLGL